MMTIRERVLMVLQGKQPDYVPWYGDLDYWKHYLKGTGKFTGGDEDNAISQLHRELGVGFYLQGCYPLKWTPAPEIKYRVEKEGLIHTTIVETPVGSVREVVRELPESYTGGVIEHFVKTSADLKVIRRWNENMIFEPEYEKVEKKRGLIGSQGISLAYLFKSPLMQMATYFAGVEATVYAQVDDPEEFDKTMAVLSASADEANRIAVNSPAECLMIPENLSSEVIGKILFEKYMRPYEEKWVGKIKDAGKYSFIHMDGTLKGLIKEVSSTGFDVLEALTPWPVGDIPMEEMHKWVDKDTVIWGGIPGLYFTDLIKDEEFDRFVIGLLKVMKTEPRYVLGVADQVPPRSRRERVKRVSELVEQYGKY